MKSNKNLLYLFLALLLIYGVTQVFNTKKDRSFKSEILKVDTSSISKIVIHAAGDQHKETVLTKTDGSWMANQGNKTVPVAAGTLDGIIKELPLMKVKAIATQSKDKYNEYEIGDSTGSHIEVYAGSKKIADFYSGKFGFNPQSNSMLSYIRLVGDPNVYAVDGFQSMTFNAPFSSFRDKSILNSNVDQIQKVSVVSNGNKLELSKDATAGWLLNNNPLKDSTAIQNYLNSIRSLSGSELLDEFSKSDSPSHSGMVTINGSNTTVDLYSTGDTLKPFIIHSSANPDVYFKEDSNNVYRTLIGGLSSLISAPVTKKK
jgi:hypothetical protein